MTAGVMKVNAVSRLLANAVFQIRANCSVLYSECRSVCRLYFLNVVGEECLCVLVTTGVIITNIANPLFLHSAIMCFIGCDCQMNTSMLS